MKEDIKKSITTHMMDGSSGVVGYFDRQDGVSTTIYRAAVERLICGEKTVLLYPVGIVSRIAFDAIHDILVSRNIQSGAILYSNHDYIQHESGGEIVIVTMSTAYPYTRLFSFKDHLFVMDSCEKYLRYASSKISLLTEFNALFERTSWQSYSTFDIGFVDIPKPFMRPRKVLTPSHPYGKVIPHF